MNNKLNDLILNEVCNTLGLKKDFVLSKNRIRRNVEARFIVAYLLKNNTKQTLESIGKILNIDHSTVIYGINQANLLTEVNVPFREKLNKCKLSTYYYFNEYDFAGVIQL